MRKAATLTVVVMILSAVPARADDSSALLKAVGGATAAYLYEVHQKVGIVADARAKKLYPPETCESEVRITLNILKVVDKQISELLTSDISADEKKSVRAIKAVIGKEVKAAEALKSYWDGKDADDLEAYKTNREEGWAALKKLMGVKDDPAVIKPKAGD